MEEFEKINDAMESEENEVLSEQASLDETAENIEASQDAAEIDEVLEETGELSESAQEFELSEGMTDSVEEQAPKKQSVIEKTIIKAACIFLVTLVVFGVCIIVKNVMTPSIEGVWVQTKAYYKGNEAQGQKFDKTPKKAIYYKFASDNDLTFCSGTITQKLKWSYADKNGKAANEATDYIIVYSEEQQNSAVPYKWSISENKSSKKILKLTMTGQMTAISEFEAYDGSEIPEYKMKADKNFKPVKELIGEWNDKKTKQTITLNEDGSYVLNISDTIFYKGSYTVNTKKKTLNLKFVTDGIESSMGDLPYSIKGDKLTLAKYEFTKVK